MKRKLAIVVITAVVLLAGLATAPNAHAATGIDALDYYSATYRTVTSKNFYVSRDGAYIRVALLSSSTRNDERLRVRLWLDNGYSVVTPYKTIPEGHYWTFMEYLRKGDMFRVEGSNPYGVIRVHVTY